MNEPTITQTVLFADPVDRPLVATVDQPHASSDGGALLFKAADRPLGLLADLTATIPDARVGARDARRRRRIRLVTIDRLRADAVGEHRVGGRLRVAAWRQCLYDL